MALFKEKARDYLNVIRCDEPSYLIWKWHPANPQDQYHRENAIRLGSSLRVKDGEVAVFVYKQNNGLMQDFIVGPFDSIIKTMNLPILSEIIGKVYNDDSPFQAEIYFINLAKIIQIPFVVPYFDVFDPRYLDFGVPTAVRGKLTFNISDYREFIKLHRLSSFDLNLFSNQVRDAMARYVKGVVMNAPTENNIPVVQIERAITPINNTIEKNVRARFERDFGINVSAVDISVIEVDKTSEGYLRLKEITVDLATATAKAQTEANIKNIMDMQRINAENVEETARIQREEAQYMQHKQTQSANLSAFQIEQQAQVGIEGAKALGQMGANGATSVSGDGGFNPAAMMTGMAMGGAIGRNMAGMFDGMMQGNTNISTPSQSQQPTIPPTPANLYHVVVNNAATGPFDLGTLSQMVSSGTLSKQSLVWKPGMTEWCKAEQVQELSSLFSNSVPPIPPIQ